MPTISIFFGIIVKMYNEKGGQHNYPHIHAELCPPSKNGQKKASKNEMNRSISLIY